MTWYDTRGLNNVDSRSLMMGYESFMVEIGLYFNTMVYDYKGIFDIGNEWHLVQKRFENWFITSK